MTDNESNKISIITVVFNGENYLEQTIQSVLSQSYPDIEYIVVDGGSSDSSVDIIRKYETGISKWISEPDEGIADAMNKGIALASGDYLLFLHADDYLYENDVIEKFIEDTKQSDADILAYGVLYGNPNVSLKKKLSRGMSFGINFKTGYLHQGTFCSRELFDRIGMFDTDLKIAMDYDFFLRAYRAGVVCRTEERVISVMRDTGISSQSDWQSLTSRFGEEKRVHEKNASTLFQSVMYRIYWCFYLPYRKTRYLLINL